MLVFAKSRVKEEVTLEEDDVTEDFWEKPYTELLGDTMGSATLQRSISARVRRRERVGTRDPYHLHWHCSTNCNTIAHLSILTIRIKVLITDPHCSSMLIICYINQC